MDLAAVEIDSVVSIHYSLHLDGGELVDSSRGREPMNYLHGHGNIVLGLEEELTGRKVGEQFAVAVPAEKGYGDSNPDGVQKIPRTTFPAELELKPGVALRAQDGEGTPVMMRVLEVGDQDVTVDLNHPLAGHTLYFDIEVIGVRTASAEELAHGHAHNPGDPDH